MNNFLIFRILFEIVSHISHVCFMTHETHNVYENFDLENKKLNRNVHNEFERNLLWKT